MLHKQAQELTGGRESYYLSYCVVLDFSQDKAERLRASSCSPWQPNRGG